MKRLRINLLLAVLTTLLIGCASNPPTHDENARIQSQTKVTKDQIPAEGQRKIPVTEQYEMLSLNPVVGERVARGLKADCLTGRARKK